MIEIILTRTDLYIILYRTKNITTETHNRNGKTLMKRTESRIESNPESNRKSYIMIYTELRNRNGELTK